MIALLVSLGALLSAAAGMARHIWLHRQNKPDETHSGALEVLSAEKEPDL